MIIVVLLFGKTYQGVQRRLGPFYHCVQRLFSKYRSHQDLSYGGLWRWGGQGEELVEVECYVMCVFMDWSVIGVNVGRSVVSDGAVVGNIHQMHIVMAIDWCDDGQIGRGKKGSEGLRWWKVKLTSVSDGDVDACRSPWGDVLIPRSNMLGRQSWGGGGMAKETRVPSPLVPFSHSFSLGIVWWRW